MRLCIVDMSPDTYYNHESRAAQRATRDTVRAERLQALAKKHKNKIGVQVLKMYYEREYNEIINVKAVRRIARAYDIECTIRKAWKKQKPEKATSPDAPRTTLDVLTREYGIPTPYFVFGTDTTQIFSEILNMFFYIAAIKDYGTGEFLGWAISLHNDQVLVDTCVRDAVARNGEALWSDVIYHTDRGATYTSKGHDELVTGLGALRSMSRKGNCYDNVSIESSWSTLKDWLDLSTCATLTEAKEKLDAYMQYHNYERPQWTRKKMTPIEYRNHLLGTAA